ncbi:MAG: enoyl-CoA hydratase [Actinobacteria bacterium]|nr:enoyl-CoA hydratase [Actinomycetota bacterium]
MSDDILVRERRGRTEILRLNRPEARNAMSPELSLAIEHALDDIEQQRDVWTVVITGTGPIFCAGADLKVVAQGRGLEITTKKGGFGGFAQRDFPKPIIAAVNGPALAGGFELVLACDLVVAADTATFGLPEAKRGLLAAAGGPIRLAKRVALATALELVMLGEQMPVARAYELGLVNRVVPEANVLDEALALADAINESSPTAVRIGRRLVKDAANLTEAEGWERTNELSRELFSSGDAIEGATAFVEKRAPKWGDPPA